MRKMKRASLIPETEDTNPKDLVGQKKLPVGLVPDTAVAHMSTALLEGALKYGRYNWRIKGVRASVYNDALERHRMKWWNGQNADPVTRVHHLANLMACAGIVLDAEVAGCLVDDRPPSVEVAKMVDDLAATVVHLQGLFAAHKPKQYTIADTAKK